MRTHTKKIIVLGSFHHFRNLNNYDDFRFWEPKKSEKTP